MIGGQDTSRNFAELGRGKRGRGRQGRIWAWLERAMMRAVRGVAKAHPGKVDLHRLKAPPALKHAPDLVHEGRGVAGLGVNREHARMDVTGIEGVAYKPSHAVHLFVDDPEELPRLGRIETRSRPKRCRGRALDRDERCAELLAHHPEERRAPALEPFERGQILHRDDHRHDFAVPVMDRGFGSP